MSTISSVGNSYLSTGNATAINQARQHAGRVDNDGDAGRPHRGGGGHRIGGAIGEALQQLGLNLPPPPAASGGAPAGPAQPPGTSDVGRAFHEFAHTLFQALRSQGQGQDLSEGAGQPGQNRLERSVQSLLQQISSPTGSSDSTLSGLTDAFNNLVKALGGTGSSGGSGTAPTLQAFLEKFQQDLQRGGNVSTSGLSVNTVA